MVELPRLWSSARLKMEDDNLHDILSCDLSKVVSCLKVRVTENSFLDASKARGVFSLFESVDVTYTPQPVVWVLLGAIQQVKDLHLKTLSLNVTWWMGKIDPILFTGLVRLETCTLYRIPAVQLEALFQAIIAADNINLKSLELGSCSISGVSPRLFQALTKLEEFKLVNTILPSECLTAMLAFAYDAMPMLKKLVIRRTEVKRTGVEPEPVESIVQSMEEHRLEFGTTPRLTLDFEVRSDGPHWSYDIPLDELSLDYYY